MSIDTTSHGGEIFPPGERRDPPEYKMPPSFDEKEDRKDWQMVVRGLECVGLTFRKWDDEEYPPTGKVRGERIIAEHVSYYGNDGGHDQRAFVYVTKHGLIGIRTGENAQTRVYDEVTKATTFLKEKGLGQWSDQS